MDEVWPIIGWSAAVLGGALCVMGAYACWVMWQDAQKSVADSKRLVEHVRKLRGDTGK